MYFYEILNKLTLNLSTYLNYYLHLVSYNSLRKLIYLQKIN